MSFTPEYRTQLRHSLLARAVADPRITAAAITGSAAENAEDAWSDIDLAFAMANPADLPELLADWTAHLNPAHHLDMPFGPWHYRVFLLPNTLQVDLAFVSAEEFRPLAPTFQLVFGQAQPAALLPSASADNLIGMGWLYALHARSAIARGKYWQAEYMISAMRDTALSLACLRHGLTTAHAKGVHQLPKAVTQPLESTLIRELTAQELTRAFTAAITALESEIHQAAPTLHLPQISLSAVLPENPAV